MLSYSPSNGFIAHSHVDFFLNVIPSFFGAITAILKLDGSFQSRFKVTGSNQMYDVCMTLSPVHEFACTPYLTSW